MQVNNVQNSPNFGMAMIITKGAKSAMNMASMNELMQLGEYGKALKDHSHVDLYLKEGLDAVVKSRRSGKAVKGPFEVISEPKDNVLTVIARNVEPVDDLNHFGKYVDTNLYFESQEAAKNAMDTLKKVNGLEAAVKYAEYAEQSEKVLAEKAKALKEQNAVKDNFVETLFNDFGEK